MIDHDAIALFEELMSRYPMAAAGLIDDLCSKLSAILEDENRNESTVAEACETLRRIFRPIDCRQFPDSYPWDAAYDRFGRWLVRGLPQYREALITITGWSEEQMNACKSRHKEMARIIRDDWNRVVNFLENKVVETPIPEN